jgi:LysM repeat protein
MTAGTKVFLAVVAVLVAVLVVYYAFLTDDGITDEVTLDSGASSESSVADDPRLPQTPRREPSVERPRIEPPVTAPPREQPILHQPEPEQEPEPSPAMDEVDDEELFESDTTDDVAVQDRDEPEPLDDHAPVRVTEHVHGDDGGKDADDQPAPRDDAHEQPAGEREHQADAPAPVPPRETPPRDVPRRTESPVPPPPQFTDYAVRSGDTMSSIASDWFGDASKWDLIAKANPFVDPNRLTVGQVLRLPPKDAQRETIEGRAGDTATIYVVRSGDNLTKIARAYYNDVSLWRLIYDTNRQTIGPNPNALRVGMRLTIPPAPKPATDDRRE